MSCYIRCCNGKNYGAEKKVKKKLKVSDKLVEYNKYIVSNMRKRERENRILKMRVIKEARLSLITAHIARSHKKETVGYRCY